MGVFADSVLTPIKDRQDDPMDSFPAAPGHVVVGLPHGQGVVGSIHLGEPEDDQTSTNEAKCPEMSFIFLGRFFCSILVE